MALITIGETTILGNVGGANLGDINAFSATLLQTATIKSLSWYVTALATDNIRLGIYDATGPSNGPGALLAQSASTNVGTASAAWITANVVTPVSLPAANYWLAAECDDSINIAFVGSGSQANATATYGPLPATFSTTPTNSGFHWSLYATLDTGVILTSGGAPRMAGWFYS